MARQRPCRALPGGGGVGGSQHISQAAGRSETAGRICSGPFVLGVGGAQEGVSWKALGDFPPELIPDPGQAPGGPSPSTWRLVTCNLFPAPLLPPPSIWVWAVISFLASQGVVAPRHWGHICLESSYRGGTLPLGGSESVFCYSGAGEGKCQPVSEPGTCLGSHCIWGAATAQPRSCLMAVPGGATPGPFRH